MTSGSGRSGHVNRRLPAGSRPLSMAAAMMFSAPLTLVRMHSVGLYSAAGTCLSAAAWIT